MPLGSGTSITYKLTGSGPVYDWHDEITTDGGYVLFYTHPEVMPHFRKEIGREYEILDFKFTDDGVTTWQQ